MACKVAFVGVVLATGAIGCAEEEPEPTFDPDTVVTIEQGVYGKATLIFCTEAECSHDPERDASARVFRGDVDADTSDAPVAETITDERGFFELEARAGRVLALPRELPPAALRGLHARVG